jgi:hypothetical protein
MTEKLFITVDEYDNLKKFDSLKKAISSIKKDMDDDYDTPDLNEYIKENGIEVFEVTRAIHIKEEVIRTLYINGEIASL